VFKGMAPKGELWEGGGPAVQNEAVDLQHGTTADGDSHSCNQGHYPKEKFSIWKPIC
jgi:hypothetical protein